MLLHRSLHPLSKSTHLRRPFSGAGAAFAVIHQNGNPSTPPPPSPQPPLTYLDGFPRPDPKFAETILAIPRASSGKYVAAKERKAGRVPGIVFEQEDGQHGGNKRLISVRTNQIRKLVNQLGSSFFLSRLFDLEVRTDFDSEAETVLVEKVRVLPRLLHLNSATDEPINVTFIRAPSHALLKVDVPLVYRGEDVSPGLRKGAYLNIIHRTAKFLCPADVIPPYIEMDLSELDAGQRVVIGDLKVHPDLLSLRPKEEPVCKIMGSRASDQKKNLFVRLWGPELLTKRNLDNHFLSDLVAPII